MHNRLSPGVVLLTLLFAPSAAFAQEEKKPEKLPAKGDTVIAVGCLRGAVLESQETRLTDDSGRIEAPIAYRLTGDKEALKQLKADHSRHLEEITGVLKSRLPDGTGPGKQIGNTRIFVGVAPANPSQPQALPVLQVTSFKHIAAECGR